MNCRLLGPFVCVAVILGGCATVEKQYDPADDNARTGLEQGLKKLDEEKPAEAARIFEKVLSKNPATEFDFVLLYNLGAARESMKDCRTAAEHYREVARGSAKKFLRIEAMALFRLSYTYECMGQDDKALVSLLDTRRRAKALQEDVAKSELPARIAAAYARSGNRVEAEKYFKEALNGVKYLQNKYKSSRVLADTLAQTLFYMGSSHVGEAEFLKNPIAQIKALELMQLYLLQAAELSSARWSGKAVDEILTNYARVWRFTEKLDGVETSDAAIRMRQKRQLNSDVLRETLRSVKILRAQRLPSRIETGDVQRLFSKLEDEERKITSVLADLAQDTQLTPQAEKRQGLKAPGRIKSQNDSVLESEAKKRSKLPSKGG